MVPKVNSGANVYGVLQYNRIKVEAGEGRILYMQGIPERSDGRFAGRWNTSTACMCPKTAACKQNRKNCTGSITFGAI